MKIALALAVALVAFVPVSSHAQTFRPGGAARGGQGGAAHPAPTASHGGGHFHRHAASGGSGARYDHDHGRGYRSYGSSYGYDAGRYYYLPTYSYYPGYGDAYPYTYHDIGYSSSGAANGLLLGALAGGIIGHNSGEFRHNGWRGAAWGAGLGWRLGSVADANRRTVSSGGAPVIVSPAPAVLYAQPAAPAPQSVTIINNYYGPTSPMSGANALFGR